MQTKRYFQILTLLLLGGTFSLSAQALLRLEHPQRCIYLPTLPEEELYAFESFDTEIRDLVAEILQKNGDLEQNFTLIQSNVENVTAIVDGENRYLLWSLEFWETASPLLRLASLAHEMGHHLNEHALTPALQHLEEPEADEFMGYTLSMFNVPPISVQAAQKALGIEPNNAPYNRLTAIFNGYERADRSLHIASLAFDADADWDAFQKADFPFPPPDCYQAIEIGLTPFSDCRTLGEVSKKMSQTLLKGGYPYRYLSLSDGFAVVTQLEQYQEDGSILPDSKLRWQELPKGENFAWSMDYFKTLIFPRKAYLRLFAILVTKRSYPSTATKISKDEAKAWVRKGLNRLPKTIGDQKCSGYSVDVLVYEFEVPQTNFKPTQHCPCHLSARDHLQKTPMRIWLR